jgi:hypothetical protein
MGTTLWGITRMRLTKHHPAWRAIPGRALKVRPLVHSDLSEAMSMEQRYFTSDRTIRS